MEVHAAVDRVLLGEAIATLAVAFRDGLVVEMGLDPRDAPPQLFQKETSLFVNKVCRELGDRHAGDQRAMIALRDWVQQVRDYDVWDALLTNFDFSDKDVLVERGRVLFPGPMTSHWDG